MITETQVKMAFEYSCKLDVFSIKPGNVSYNNPGYNMTHKDFLQSSMACSDIICEKGMDIGTKIYESVKSSVDVVGCNTNLGIILLCTPIVQSLYLDEKHRFSRENLKKTILDIDHKQTKKIYEAINIANAGGMGEKDEYDIKKSGNCNFKLYEAMKYASSYDDIANEYYCFFDNIINNISPFWRICFNKMNNDESATTATFLSLLSKRPDSLIARKYGVMKAKNVSEQVKSLANEYCELKNPKILNKKLLLLDSELKIQGLNPGTTADVVVASIFFNRLGL